MRFYLETERLILRDLVPEDYQAAFLWCGDPDVARYMVYPVYTKAEDVKTWLESLTSSLEMVKKLYPDLDLSFELRSDAEGKEARQDGMGEDDPDRDPELSSGRR